ncbi:hypothetical protein SRRS_52300 [Sporomusa rhizae]|uniref:helix-turn-helix domain-containing protein n=1 Tax=Sporomusa rhizae TaxID=357999 RepID=UPI00352A65C5
MDNAEIVERLKQIRKETGLSMDKFSKALGIQSSGNISAWESGRALPGAIALKAIHDVFGYSVDWILTGNNSTACSKSESPKVFRTELLQIFDSLTPDKQAILLGTIKTILQNSAVNSSGKDKIY